MLCALSEWRCFETFSIYSCTNLVFKWQQQQQQWQQKKCLLYPFSFYSPLFFSYSFCSPFPYDRAQSSSLLQRFLFYFRRNGKHTHIFNVKALAPPPNHSPSRFFYIFITTIHLSSEKHSTVLGRCR